MMEPDATVMSGILPDPMKTSTAYTALNCSRTGFLNRAYRLGLRPVGKLDDTLTGAQMWALSDVQKVADAMGRNLGGTS